MQSDPSGGALFSLTVLTEVAVLSIQLLLLQGGRRGVTIVKTAHTNIYTSRHFQTQSFDFGTHTKSNSKSNWTDELN